MAQPRQLDNLPLDQAPSTEAKSRTQGRNRAEEPLHGPSPPQLSRPRSENRKRPTGDPPSDLTLAKRLKTIPRRPWNFCPEFYDNLSRIWLTPLALQELDRRNHEEARSNPVITPASIGPPVGAGTIGLARFARMGGPDLSDLRGYQDPTSLQYPMALPLDPSLNSRPTQVTKPTTVSFKRSTAYDGNFRQHCKDNYIYPPFYKFPDGYHPKPANLDEIRQALKVPRGSLSPSVVSEAVFEDFQMRNTTKSEGTVMRNVIPFVAGDSEIHNEGNLPFINLASLTNNMTVNPYPDFFDGAHPDAVDQEVKQELEKIIVPTKKADAPIAPNLYLEAKSSGGSLDVAEGQVMLDGAYGATMMHSLQNYLLEEPGYDGNAYTFTAVFIGGHLHLYAHHLTAPVNPGQNPGCHMTQVNAYALTGNPEGFLEGIGAFRNVRKLAKQYRDQFIEVANARACVRASEITAIDEETLAIGPKQDDELSSAILLDSLPFADSRGNDEETQDAVGGLGILQHEYGTDAEDGSLSQH